MFKQKDHFQKYFGRYTAILGVAVLATGLLFAGCGEADSSKDSKGNTAEGGTRIDVPAFDGGTIKELSRNGQQPILVFVVYDKDKVAVFRNPSLTKDPSKYTFPLHAENVASWQTISVIKTTNPKYCWISGGDLECVSW